MILIAFGSLLPKHILDPAPHGYTHTCMHTQVRVCGQILSLQDSFIIWVGTAKPAFANLDVAMCSNMNSMPITSTLLGNTTEGFLFPSACGHIQ